MRKLFIKGVNKGQMKGLSILSSEEWLMSGLSFSQANASYKK